MKKISTLEKIKDSLRLKDRRDTVAERERKCERGVSWCISMISVLEIEFNVDAAVYSGGAKGANRGYVRNSWKDFTLAYKAGETRPSASSYILAGTPLMTGLIS